MAHSWQQQIVGRGAPSYHDEGPSLGRRLRLAPLLSVCLIIVMISVACARQTEVTLPEEPRAPVGVSAAVDRAVATTGDLITYRLTVDYDPAYEVEIPEAGAEIAGFRIVDLGREEPQDRKGRAIEERWYLLRADLVGSYVLPPVAVNYRETTAPGEESGAWESLSTSEIFVEVESVLPAEGQAEDIRGLKPLRRIQPAVPWMWILVGLTGALLVAGLVWLYLRHRVGRVEVLPPIPPHELAFRALSELRTANFDDPEAVRLFHFRISEAIRTYVEGRYGLNATDLTTEEICAHLPALSELEEEQNSALQRFLTDTDQVKFAHHEPDKPEIEMTYERALSFVEATRPVTDEMEREAA